MFVQKRLYILHQFFNRPSMNIDAIRQALLKGNSPSLKRRRKIALLSVFGILDFCLISLYQLGIIKAMPDPPGKIFDSAKANGSRDAYQFGAPDGPISLLMYAGNILLASALGSRKSGRPPVFDLLLGGLIAGSALGSVNYMYSMIFKQQKACPYCITGAALNFAMIPYVYPEVKASLQEMMRN
jgi:uncharacterized membrane protein